MDLNAKAVAPYIHVYVHMFLHTYVSQGVKNLTVTTHNNIFPLAQGSGTYTCRAGNTWLYPLSQMWVTVKQL